MPITFLDEEEEQIAPVTPTKRKITFLDEEEAGITPTTPQPSQYKYDPARSRPRGLATPKGEKEVGTIEGITNAAMNAFDSSRQALDIVGDVTPEEAQNIAKIEFDKQSRKVAPGYDEYQKAEGFDAVLAFAKNPIEVTSNIIAEGLAGSLPALGAGLAAGGVGAAAGSVVPVVGTGVGFTAGQVAGTFAGSLATEYGSKILEEMQEGGVDLTKPESIQGFFENEEAVTAARDKAIKRGIPVAAFDAISAGIGGKLGRVFGKQFLTKTGEAAAELGVQAGLGGGGEVAGALAAGEPIEGKAVFGEIIGEAGPGAAEIITGRMADRAARLKAEEDAKIKAAAELSTNLEENNAPLTAAAVKSTTATTIEQDKLAAQLEEELDADEINKQVSGQLAVTKEPTAAPPAIQSKEEFAAIYSQVAPEELDAAEAGFTQQAATAATEEGRANAQNALEAIKEVKATVTPPAPPVEPAITPAVQPAVPTAQLPITDATQEIIQPEGVRQEPQDRVEGQPPEEAGVGRSILGAARGEEEGQVVPTPTAEAIKPEEIKEVLGGFAKGAVGNLYDMLFGKLQTGDTTELGQPSRVLAEAMPAYQAGIIKDANDLRNWVQGDPRIREAFEKTKAVPTAEEPLAVKQASITIKDSTQKKTDPKTGEKINVPVKDFTIETPQKGSAYGYISNNVANIVGINAPKREDSVIQPQRGTQTYPQVIQKLKESGVTTLRVAMPSRDSQVALEKLVANGTLSNPRDFSGPSDASYPTTWDIVGEQPAEPIISEKPATSELVGAEPAAIVEQEPVAPAETAPDRLYLNVPFNRKEAAKSVGAKFDPERKLWYLQRQASGEFAPISSSFIKEAEATTFSAKELEPARINAEAQLGQEIEIESFETPTGTAYGLKVKGGDWLNKNINLEIERQQAKVEPVAAGGGTEMATMEVQSSAPGGIPTETADELYSRLAKNKEDEIRKEISEIKKGRKNPKSKWYGARDSEISKREREIGSLQFGDWGIVVDAFDAELAAKRPVSDVWNDLFIKQRLSPDEFQARLNRAGYTKQGDVYVYQAPAPVTTPAPAETPAAPAPAVTEAEDVATIANKLITGRVERLYDEASRTSGGRGIAAGSAGARQQIEAASLTDMRKAIQGGASLQDAASTAKTSAREMIKKHNAQRKGDVNWQINDDFADAQIDRTVLDISDVQAGKVDIGAKGYVVSKETTTPATPTPAAPAAEPAGIAVGNRVKTKTTPQSYVVEEVLPQSAREAELGEQYYRIKNERTGESQTVEANDIKIVKGKGVRKMAAATRNEEYMRLAQDPEANREQLQRMVDEAAKKAGYNVGPVYHGHKGERFTEFSKDLLGKTTGARTASLGFFFSKTPYVAQQFEGFGEKQRVPTKNFISTKNPITFKSEFVIKNAEIAKDRYGVPLLKMDAFDKFWKMVSKMLKKEKADISRDDIIKLRSSWEKLGYDSIRFEGTMMDSGANPDNQFVVFSPEQIKSADPVTYDDAGNIIPLEERFQATSPDIRRMAAEIRVEEDAPSIPKAEQYTYDEVSNAAAKFFGGVTPENLVIVNDTVDPDFRFKASYDPNTGQIQINLAYIRKGENIEDIITHELGHFIYSDPQFQEAFQNFWDSISDEDQAKINDLVNTSYNNETMQTQIEERQVIAFASLVKKNRETATAWDRLKDTIKAWINRVFGTNIALSDQGAMAVMSSAFKRFKSGEQIIREMDSGVLRMAAEPVEATPAQEARREQFAGMKIGRIITTPPGIKQKTTDVIRAKFFDSTKVSAENTSQAWAYISQFMDKTDNSNNKFAGYVNNVTESELPEADKSSVEESLGAVMLSVELANYAGRLAVQGDTKMLSYIIRNGNRMPTGEYAQGVRKAGQDLNAVKERLKDQAAGFAAFNAELKSNVERLASTLFGTNSPNEDQIKIAQQALTDSENIELGDAAQVAADIKEVEGRTKTNLIDKVDAKVNQAIDKSGKIKDLEKKATRPRSIESQVESVVESLQRSLGELPPLPQKRESEIRVIVQQDLRQNPDMGRREPWNNMLIGRLMQAGVTAEQAQTIADLTWKQHEQKAINRELKELRKAVEEGSLAVIIDRIKNTPLEKQQSPEWRKDVIMEYLREAGLSTKAAETAAKLYDSVISERLAAAKQKAFEDTLAKAAPWKDYASRNGKLAKDALKKIQNAIRTGVLDPDKTPESIIAAQNGWTGFTKEQYQRIVEIDTILNDPNKDDLVKKEAMAELGKIITQAKLPAKFREAIADYYVGQALLGIPTFSVNIFSPAGFSFRNIVTDMGRYAFTDPKRIPIAFESLLDSMRSWYGNVSYSFRTEIYPNDVVEYLQGGDALKEIFNKGKKQWAEGKYAQGFGNMAVGMAHITKKVLSALDQGAISMIENQNLTRYAMEALAAQKTIPKDQIRAFGQAILAIRNQSIAQSVSEGMSRDRAIVLADLAAKSELIYSLSKYKISPDEVLDSAINDALQSVGRNRKITLTGIEESEKAVSDTGTLTYLPIRFLEMIAEKSMQSGPAMQVFSKMVYGFALIPARVFSNVAWFSPVGAYRFAVDAFAKSQGWKSPYAMSLGTGLQYRQRLTETIAGSIAMLGLMALRSDSTEDDEDKKFKIVITGNGPNAVTDKQYYDSWMKKWKPYSIHIVVDGNIIPINIGRGGEAFFFPIMLAGALDDLAIKKKQNLTKKEPEDLVSAVEVLGSSFFALAQRGPYAAFTKPLFDASKQGRVTEELASQAGYFGKTFIPVLGTSLARNITDFINDPVDRSSIEGAIYANTPIVGPWLGTKALNALGQPIRADDWGDKLFKLGVPVVFSFPKDTPMNELNELILKQGSGPTIPTRANAQKRFGDILTDKEFETYVREYGRVMSDKMFKNRTRLANLKPADYDDELEKYARGYSIDGIKIKGASDSAVLAVKRMRQ